MQSDRPKTKTQAMKLYILLFLSALVVVFSIIAPSFAPNDPLEVNFNAVLEPSSEQFILGTDQLGRCVYSRLLYGTKATLGTSFLIIFAMSIIGIILGSIAGFRRGLSDSLIMRVGDILLALPEVVIVIVIVSAFGVGILNTIFALSLIWWVKYSRLTRVLVQKEIGSNYVHVARMSGASEVRVFVYYVLPNILPILIIQIALNIGTIIIALASFSFLGLGVQPPTPEWGNMLSEARVYIQTAPYLMIYPGLAIFLTVLLFNYLGETLRLILSVKE